MSDTIQLTIMNETKYYPRGTRYMDVAREIQEHYKDDIVLMMMDNQLRELRKEISEDGVLTAVTTKDPAGSSTYRRSVVLLMQRAYHNL
ncbi:MAG: nucleoside kinase, partial [Lachnospiraceae bacterium]|nr:nucleoside kinase [Lachnospiraceae bacterium]